MSHFPVRVWVPSMFVAVLGACFSSQVPDSGRAPAAGVDAGSVLATDGTGPRTAPQRGEVLVHARGCAGCHQSTDSKDGTLSGRATPVGGGAYPPNLTPDKETGIGDWTEEQIVRAIREGKNDELSDLCTVMPRYADLSYAEASDIVAYLRGLPPKSHAVPESECDRGPSDSGAPDPTGDDAGDAAADDGGADAQPQADGSVDGTCPGFASPGTAASCHGCGTHPCQPNGCYGGYYCELATSKCHAKPATCP